MEKLSILLGIAILTFGHGFLYLSKHGKRGFHEFRRLSTNSYSRHLIERNSVMRMTSDDDEEDIPEIDNVYDIQALEMIYRGPSHPDPITPYSIRASSPSNGKKLETLRTGMEMMWAMDTCSEDDSCSLICQDCQGTGVQVCSVCEGHGHMKFGDYKAYDSHGNPVNCAKCHACGREPCRSCHGKGAIAKWMRPMEEV